MRTVGTVLPSIGRSGNSPNLPLAAQKWDAPYMEEAASPLQKFIRAAVEGMPHKRDHYDRKLQAILGTKGKPLYDIDRGKSKNPSLSQLNAISDVLGQPRELIERALEGHVVCPLAASDTSDGVPTGLEAEAGRDNSMAYADMSENVVTLRSFDLSYSMGPGTNIDDYVEEEPFQFDAGMLSRLTRADPDHVFVAKGDGDSMFPTVLNEDTIVIDTTQKIVNLRDRIWACSIHGAGAVKRLRPAADGKMEIISDNPAVKDDVVDAADIHIIGRVIWLGRRV